MISNAPQEARWLRSEPRRTLPSNLLERMVRSAFPGGRVLQCDALTDGLRNSNFKLRIDSLSGPAVLRIYEHDPTLCQKEMDLWELVGKSVPVPKVICVEPWGTADLPPFALLHYVEGITFRELKRRGNPAAIAQAAHSAGQTLAAIHRHVFARPGWLGPGPSVTAPLLEGPDAMARFVDLCLDSENLRRRLPAAAREGVHNILWSARPELAHCEEQTKLAHGDFGKRNVLVREVQGRWEVAAVLDWEFAVSGTPLADLANFLRYERTSRPGVEPFFSNGYAEAGGTLPEDWRRLARLVDLVALCEALTRDSIPNDAAAEIAELIVEQVANLGRVANPPAGA